jgi:hypothetical protein
LPRIRNEKRTFLVKFPLYSMNYSFFRYETCANDTLPTEFLTTSVLYHYFVIKFSDIIFVGRHFVLYILGCPF